LSKHIPSLSTKYTEIVKINLAAFLFVLVTFCSCANLQVFEPIQESTFTSETNFAGYNSEAQVAWLISSDDSNLIIRLETESRMSKMKILRTGMYVFFSTSGKKKKNNYIHFPVKVEKKVKDESTDQKNSSNRRGQRVTTQDLINTINPIAEYVYGDKKQEFHYKIDTSDFKISLSEDTNTLLKYTVTIPYSKMVDDPTQLNGLIVGLVSGSFSTPVSTRPMPSSRPTNNRQYRGGGMPNSGPTMPAGGQSRTFSAMAEPIKIWFKLENVN
jgi:hypothetical protein